MAFGPCSGRRYIEIFCDFHTLPPFICDIAHKLEVRVSEGYGSHVPLGASWRWMKTVAYRHYPGMYIYSKILWLYVSFLRSMLSKKTTSFEKIFETFFFKYSEYCLLFSCRTSLPIGICTYWQNEFFHVLGYWGICLSHHLLWAREKTDATINYG